MADSRDIAIEAENLGKKFRIASAGGHAGFRNYRTLRDSVRDAFLAPGRWIGAVPPRPEPEVFWALDDVSFAIRRGESVGIVGRNGAGKSTLLKVLGRITRPTRGRAIVRGRVGALLEVGTSFHPELTGRENIHLNGAILGMTREEIRRRFDEIVAFSEVERFLDVPVKRYSSGMFIRLAFGVAAHLDSEVLLIDEVLAVGDASFQRKCLGRMGEQGKEGRTVLFVSHNMAALQALCARALWIEAGKVRRDGPAGEVIKSYLQTSFQPATERIWEEKGKAPGNDELRIRAARVRPVGGSPSDPLAISAPIEIEIEYWNLHRGSALDLTIDVNNEQGVTVFRSASITDTAWHGKEFPEGLYRSTCTIPADLLNAGTHYLDAWWRRDMGLTVLREEGLLTFHVLDDPERRGTCHGDWPGAVRPRLQWRTARIDGPPDGAS